MQALQLHRLDSAYPNGIISKTCPILTTSSLRRAAYATLVITIITDSNQHGLSTLPDDALRETRLPHRTFSQTGSDERYSPTWIGHAITIGLDSSKQPDVTAALIQAYAIRRRVAEAVSANAHEREGQNGVSSISLSLLQEEVTSAFAAVPFADVDSTSLERHKDEAGMFVQLHLVRLQVNMILARHRILAFQQLKHDREATDRDRAERVDLAYAVATVIAKAREHGARLGVQSGVIAFVSLEGR